MAMTKDEKNARRRARYAEDPTKVREQNALWRVRNPESAKDCDRRSYEKRRDSISAYKREYYKANAEQEKARAEEWYEANRSRRLAKDAKRRAWFEEVKATKGCKSCGERDPVVLDFHHRNPAEKCFDFGGSACRSLKRLEEEMAKCDILCRNCHARLHSIEGNKPHQIARGLSTA